MHSLRADKVCLKLFHCFCIINRTGFLCAAEVFLAQFISASLCFQGAIEHCSFERKLASDGRHIRFADVQSARNNDFSSGRTGSYPLIAGSGNSSIRCSCIQFSLLSLAADTQVGLQRCKVT